MSKLSRQSLQVVKHDKKFVARFGLDAMKFVNSAVGRELHLRGINAKVVLPGLIRVGDVAKKV